MAGTIQINAPTKTKKKKPAASTELVSMTRAKYIDMLFALGREAQYAMKKAGLPNPDDFVAEISDSAKIKLWTTCGIMLGSIPFDETSPYWAKIIDTIYVNPQYHDLLSILSASKRTTLPQTMVDRIVLRAKHRNLFESFFEDMGRPDFPTELAMQFVQAVIASDRHEFFVPIVRDALDYGKDLSIKIEEMPETTRTLFQNYIDDYTISQDHLYALVRRRITPELVRKVFLNEDAK